MKHPIKEAVVIGLLEGVRDEMAKAYREFTVDHDADKAKRAVEAAFSDLRFLREMVEDTSEGL